MEIPKGYTEEQVLQIIERISNKLAGTFKFGYFEIEDMKQEAALFAWQGLKNYDGVRPLENFLWVHVRNRLYNLKRNNYSRLDKPCLDCPFNAYKNHECTKFFNMLDCDLYERWELRNQVKKNLMSTKDQTDPAQAQSSSAEEELFSRELYNVIDENIPVNLREDWIRLTYKLKLSKQKREMLLEIIKEILIENGIEPEEG